jgi:hypothetical protein
MAERTRNADRFDTEMAAMDADIDPLPLAQRARGRLYVMAQPVSSPAIKLSEVIGGKRILEIVVETPRQHRPQWATGFEHLGYEIGHPDGRAAATDAPTDWDAEHESYLGFLLLRDDGAVQYVSGDAVRTWEEERPPCISLAGVCEALHEVANLASHLSTEYLNCAGQWRLGLRITGLRGLYPSQKYHPSRGGHRFNPFQTDSYTRITAVRVEQMSDPSSAVVEAVAADLARGLNLDRLAFPYTDIGHMARKLGIG